MTCFDSMGGQHCNNVKSMFFFFILRNELFSRCKVDQFREQRKKLTTFDFKPELFEKYIVPFEVSNGEQKPFGNKMKWTWKDCFNAVGFNPKGNLQKCDEA